MEKISVIIPVYNVKDYLEKCLDSVINQTYQELEIIIIDDGSTDGSELICESYANKDNRIVLIHQENNGLSAARNAGMKIATGRYFAFVDGDDYIEKEMYEELYHSLVNNGSDIGVCGRCEHNDDDSFYAYNFSKPLAINKNESIKLLLEDDSFGYMVWNKLYKREIFNGIVFPEGKVYEDIAIQHLLIENADKVSVISAPYYHHAYRDGSISKKICIKTFIDYLDALDNLIDYYKDSEHCKYILINKFRINEYIWMRLSSIKNKNNVEEKIFKQTRKEIIEHIGFIFNVNLKYKLSAIAITFFPHCFAWAINNRTLSSVISSMNKRLH